MDFQIINENLVHQKKKSRVWFGCMPTGLEIAETWF
jgi:hypothetical protein